MELLLPCLLLFISLFTRAHCVDQQYNAIFSFGNSYSDTGNFIILVKGVFPYDVFEHLPYGMTYFGHPTGRACDGRLILDFIAQDLGLPLVPPYLDQGQNFSAGANFAVIGATALNLDYFRQHNITNVPPVDTSISFQLNLFQQLRSSVCNSTTSCQDYFSRSLYILGEFGGNDYNFVLSAGKSISEALSYVPAVIETIKQAAEMASEWAPIFPSIKIMRSKCTFQFEIDYNKSKDLPAGEFHFFLHIHCGSLPPGGYDWAIQFGITRKNIGLSLLKQGALNIVIPGNLPTGCIPILLTNFASKNKSDYDHLGCLKKYNTIGSYHNSMLKEAVAQLQVAYPTARIIYADYYQPMIQFLQNPTKFGFTGEPLRICCGGGGPYNYNVSATCGLPNVPACSNPSTSLNWDGIHLTEAAYRIIATGWMKGPYAHPPISPGYY